jgi:hypothetical protein
VAAVTGDRIFVETVSEEFARAVSVEDFKRAERLATVAFGVEEARKALEQLEAGWSAGRKQGA